MQIIKTPIIILFCLQLLSACQHRNSTKPSQSKLFDLSQSNGYQFNGKMSFSNGQDGGSGRVNWQQQDGLVSAQLKAPLGSKSWHISEQAMGAKLVADGQTLLGDSAQTLISGQLGWQVPWQQLKSWIIGIPNDKDEAQIYQHENGFKILENGWQIEYSRLKPITETQSQVLPHKLVARKNNFAIKVSIKQWTW